ncbi:adenylate/guanylate cyclase domain-containing protein [Candidatus Riflebacteria bacterium]
MSFKVSLAVAAVPPNPIFFLLASIFFLFTCAMVWLVSQLIFRRYRANLAFYNKLAKDNVDLDKSFASILEDEYAEKLEETQKQITGFRDRMFFLVSNIQQMATTLDKNVIFRLVGDILRTALGIEKSILYLLSQNNEEIFSVFSAGYEGFDKKSTLANNGSNLIGTCINQGEFLYLKDQGEGTVIEHLFKKFKPEVVAVMPIIAKKKTLGAIAIGELSRDLERSDLKFIHMLGTLLGPLMENAAIFSQTKDELLSEKKFSAVELEEKKKIKELFSHYMSPKMMEVVMANPQALSLGGDKKLVSILFSDIEGFTTISESMTPEGIMSLLNEYLSEMTRLVVKYDGFVDKFVGDAVMAEFGAFGASAEDPFNAVACAMEMLKVVEDLKKKWMLEGKPLINIRIGVNTDEVVVGNVGGREKIEFTAIGDGVNVASRLEGENKKHGTRLIISENTYSQIEDRVEAVYLGSVAVKGKAEETSIYAVKKVEGVDYVATIKAPGVVAEKEKIPEYSSKSLDSKAKIPLINIKEPVKEVVKMEVSSVTEGSAQHQVILELEQELVQRDLNKPGVCGGCQNVLMDSSSGFCLICGTKIPD